MDTQRLKKAIAESTYQEVYKDQVPFAPGLHLFYGPGGSAKTTNALALQHALSLAGFSCVYRCVNEPRGLLLRPPLTAEEEAALKGGSSNGVTGAQVFPGTYDQFLADLFARAKRVGGKGVPVAIADSLTYTLKALSVTAAQVEKGKMPTYEKGLDSGTILGVLHHSQLAANEGVALIGTVNSELLPTVSVLKGACEGIFVTSAPGIVTNQSRANLRLWSELNVTQADLDWAYQQLSGLPVPKSERDKDRALHSSLTLRTSNSVM